MEIFSQVIVKSLSKDVEVLEIYTEVFTKCTD